MASPHPQRPPRPPPRRPPRPANINLFDTTTSLRQKNMDAPSPTAQGSSPSRPIPIPTRSAQGSPQSPPSPFRPRSRSSTGSSSRPKFGSPLSIVSSTEDALGTPPASTPPVVLNLTQPTTLAVWIICQKTGYFHDHFLDKVTAFTILPIAAKVWQKNMMFRMSEEALLVAGQFANLVHGYLMTLEFGQRQDARWSIETSPVFQRLRGYLNKDSTELFGARLGKKLDHGEVFIPPLVLLNRHASNAAMQGISEAQNDMIVRGIGFQIDDWNLAIKEFIEQFNPYLVPAAVQLMLVTANKLRKAANACIELVEQTYRRMLELPPVVGTSQAELVFCAIVREHNTDYLGEMRSGLTVVEIVVEEKYEKMKEMRGIKKREREMERRVEEAMGNEEEGEGSAVMEGLSEAVEGFF